MDLIFCCNLSTRSVIRSWFFLFSSCWKRSSFTRLSPLVMVLCTSSVCWMVLFNSISMAWARSSSLAGIWAAPRAMAKEACSALFCISASDTSVVLAAFSCAAAWSCSARSSSASLPASTMAFLAFSSLFLQEASMLSRSACIWWMSFSSFLLALARPVLLPTMSDTCSRESISSCSTCLWPRMAASRRAFDSSSSPPIALALRSVRPYCSITSFLIFRSSSIAAFTSPSCMWVLFMAFFGLRMSFVGMVQSNLHLIDVSLVLLLDSEGLFLCSGLSLKRSLHGVQGALVVLPGVLKLLLLLLDPPVNLLAHLGHLQLSSQHLVLLLLQSGLGLLESLLQLLLLHLQLPAGLVQLVHGAAALAQLVQQVLDLLGQVLVLPPDGVQVLQHFLVGGLDAEVLGAVVAALGLAAGDLILQILSL